jgi:site-specific recombinase XerD
MATINFFIQSRKSPAGIYVRLREGRQIDAKAKTKYIVRTEDWSSKKGQPLNLKSGNLKILKADLDKFSSKLQDHYNSSVNKLEINSQWLKDFINPPITEETVSDRLTDYFDFYIKLKNHSIDEDSIRKYRNVQSVLLAFQAFSKRVYMVRDVNDLFRSKFIEYAIEKEKYSNSYIGRMIKFIKTVCYHAEKNNIEVSPQLRSLKPIKEEKHPVIYLNPDEIKMIENVDIKFDKLVIARDWLIISIETGQRISDFMMFTKDNIRMEKGKQLLEFIQKKTETKISLPLSKKIRDILTRWDGNFPPKQLETDYNEYIKEVCQIAGLVKIISGGKNKKELNRKVYGQYQKFELITSHIGRRSFATNYFGIAPTAGIMYITGHKNESIFLKYIGKTPTEMSHLMAEYIKM